MATDTSTFQSCMMSDCEDEILEGVDAICGWGAADFDDEFKTQVRGKTERKVLVKRKPQKALLNSNSTSKLATLPRTTQAQHSQDSTALQEKQPHKPVELPLKFLQQSENLSKEQHLRRKLKPIQQLKANEQSSSKPSPRTLNSKEENAAIAASGKERRMKIVAAAMASNVPRKSSLASVVSASFDGESDEKQEGLELLSRQRNGEYVPSSAPQRDIQEILPRVPELSTAPAEIPKKINPPLSLPLLSIKPDCGGNESRLLGKSAPAPDAPRHWRRHRHQKSSHLPSRGVSDSWDSNFPLRRSRSPKQLHAELPQASSSSFTKKVRVPLAPRQEYSRPSHLKEMLPLIHRNSKEVDLVMVEASHSPAVFSNNVPLAFRDEKDNDEDEDEGWTKCYDDPAKSMAGLIQALSTFAADGKQAKLSKVGKHKRRRAKLQQVPPNAPVLRLPPPGEINVTSGRAPIAEGQQESELSTRRRKHRRLRNKQSSDGTNHDTTNQVP